MTPPLLELENTLALQDEVRSLARERDAVILAHNYELPEIQAVADYVGDSLGLSQQAAKADADVIAFCGVHFMAETASILSPEKTVLLPDLGAGCSLADSITADRPLPRRSGRMRISSADAMVGVPPPKRSCTERRIAQSQPPSGRPSAMSPSWTSGTECALATARPVEVSTASTQCSGKCCSRYP